MSSDSCTASCSVSPDFPPAPAQDLSQEVQLELHLKQDEHLAVLTDEQLKRLEQLDQPEPEAQSEPQTLPIGEVEAIANLTTKLDALANVFALVLEGIQEVREYYSADCWLPKREAAERLGISDKRLRSWMDSDELVEGRDFYDATPPGSGSPRWLVNVARTRKKISTSNLFRSARRSPVSAKPKSKARGR
jgi:hypothetical protein